MQNGSDKAVAFVLAESVNGLGEPNPAIHFAPSLRRFAQNGARRAKLSIYDSTVSGSAKQLVAGQTKSRSLIQRASKLFQPLPQGLGQNTQA